MDSLDPCVIAVINRWLGVALGLLATAVVAPDALIHLTEHWKAAARRNWAEVLAIFRGKRAQHTTEMAAMFSARGTMSAEGHAWSDGWSTDERIDALRRRLDSIDTKLRDVVGALSRETEDRERHVGEVAESLAGLREELGHAEKKRLEIDGRGLVFLAFSLVLSGVPDELAGLPSPWWVIVPWVGILLILVAISILPRSSRGDQESAGYS